MPLRCTDGTSDILAYELGPDEWSTLQAANHRDRHLHMPCCGASVILKTSKLETRFFAHTRCGECTSGPETPEHLLAKSIIACAARETGWAVTPEADGVTPSGEKWVADVLASLRSGRVAFEVQWSRQAPEETKARQDRYKTAGVRGLWFLRHALQLRPSKEVPSFLLTYDKEARAFTVKLPSDHFDPERVYSSQEASEAYYWSQSIPLAAFVKGALSGALKWAPAYDAFVTARVHLGDKDCWKCRRTTRNVTGVTLGLQSAFPGHSDLYLPFSTFRDEPEGRNALAQLLPDQVRIANGVGRIKPRFSKTVGRSYLSNGCAHCDALQGAFFEGDGGYGPDRGVSAMCTLSPEVVRLPGVRKHLDRWWFDEQAANKEL